MPENNDPTSEQMKEMSGAMAWNFATAIVQKELGFWEANKIGHFWTELAEDVLAIPGMEEFILKTIEPAITREIEENGRPLDNDDINDSLVQHGFDYEEWPPHEDLSDKQREAILAIFRKHAATI